MNIGSSPFLLSAGRAYKPIVNEAVLYPTFNARRKLMGNDWGCRQLYSYL